MFLRGELDAVTGLGFRGGGGGHSRGLSLGRVEQASQAQPDLMTLFSDPKAEAIRYFKKTGVYQPNHTTALRESIIKEHPWIVLSLMDAFEEAKRIAIERLRSNVPSLMVFGPNYMRELDEVFGRDPFPYGIKANAKAFDMAQTYSAQQGLTERKQPLEEIFPQEIFYSEERL